MSNIGNVSGSSPANGVEPFVMTGMSPDALLAYCQMQLGGLDNEMTTQMNQQSLELQEREAVESAQTALESFGTTGPQNISDFQQCENAIATAAASLPPNDPVAAQLTAFGQNIANQYGYTAPQPLTGLQRAQVAYSTSLTVESLTPGLDAAQLQSEQGGLATWTNGALTKPPANNDWQGTTDTLSNMADGIKSGAEIQMLQLQDLVSQRQQAVQLISGMMSTENQTLDGETKNIAG